MTERAPLTPELVERRLSELQQLSRLGASLAEAELPPIDRRILERRSLRVVARAAGHGADPRDVRLHVLAPAIDRQLGWMPDAWVDPSNGALVGTGWASLVAAFIAERSVDAVARRCEATIVMRLLAARPACVETLPLLEQSDQHPRLWLCSSRDRARTRW